MVELPEVNGFNALLVIINNLGKLLRLVPCRAGEGQLTAPEVAKLFLENWLDSLVFQKLSYMSTMLGSQLHFRKHCRVSWVCKRDLVALTNLKPMVRPSAKTVLSNK